MSDLRYDPEMRHRIMDEYDSRSMWAGFGVFALLVVALIVAATYSTNDTQTANRPAAETTGSSATPIPPMPTQ